MSHTCNKLFVSMKRSLFALFLFHLHFCTSIILNPRYISEGTKGITFSRLRAVKQKRSSELRRYYRSSSTYLPEKQNKRRGTDHFLSNQYLSSINKPSNRAKVQEYWKLLQSRGLQQILGKTLISYPFISSFSRCLVFSYSWYLSSIQVSWRFVYGL
jgi:hypothetical protein